LADRSLLAALAGNFGRLEAQRVGDAVVVTAANSGAGDPKGAVIEADGTIATFPIGIGIARQSVRVADKVVVIAGGGPASETTVEVYSLTDHLWSTLLAPLATGLFPFAFVAGSDLMVVSHEPGGSGDRPGVARLDVMHADASVTTGTVPDDPWALPQPGAMVVWTGHDVVTYGVDSNAFSTHLAHPTAYDPLADTYRVLSNPPWVACDPTCAWRSQHQGGDHQFAVWTGTLSLVSTSVDDTEFTGLHDPVGDVWERIPDPPIALSQPWIEASARHVTVFATNAGPTFAGGRPVPVPLGVAAVLDVETRTWSTVKFADVPAPVSGIPSSLCPVRMPAAVVVATCPDMSDPIPPMAFDSATGRWSEATDHQQRMGLIGLGTLTLEQLTTALNA
jgi:hypothetical protein